MVLFMASDSEMMDSVKKEVALYLAWKQIYEEADARDLTPSKKEEAKKSKQAKDNSINLRLNEAYPWMLIPTTDPSKPHEIYLDARRLSGGTESFVTRALNSLVSNENLNESYAPFPLKLELDGKLWANNNDISVKDIWNAYTRYCYLPRLKSFDVLCNAISEGMISGDYFAIAGGKEGDEYLDLRLKCPFGTSVDSSNYLIKKEVAEEYERQHAPIPEPTPPAPGPGGPPQPQPQPPKPEPEPAPNLKTKFHLSKDLNPVRVNKEVGEIVEEILTHLTSINGTNVRIFFSIEAETKDGIPKDKERTINENCSALNIEDYEFY